MDPQYRGTLQGTPVPPVMVAPGAFAWTADVRCDVAAPAITWAMLLRNGLENATFTGRQL